MSFVCCLMYQLLMKGFMHYQFCGPWNQLLMYKDHYRTYNVHIKPRNENYLTSTLLTPPIVHPCHFVSPPFIICIHQNVIVLDMTECYYIMINTIDIGVRIPVRRLNMFNLKITH